MAALLLPMIDFLTMAYAVGYLFLHPAESPIFSIFLLYLSVTSLIRNVDNYRE